MLSASRRSMPAYHDAVDDDLDVVLLLLVMGTGSESSLISPSTRADIPEAAAAIISFRYSPFCAHDGAAPGCGSPRQGHDGVGDLLYVWAAISRPQI